ncbi:MAG: hypothetical protein FJX35_13615 [Alphaproteobacteria bacterium]|nr:hypothetical protein [Alphaproteobacteria bacterium]
MSLAGEGVIAIWNDIAAEGRAQFYAWHGREHMPERAGIAGFLRGRRYVAIHGEPEYFTLYETIGPEVLSGTDYLNRLNNPTPWTRDSVRHFKNVSRSLCRVAASHGFGQGGLIATWRYDVSDGREEEQRKLLAHDILPRLADEAGVAGAHLCIADRAASGIVTEEKKVRKDTTAVPGWVVMAEGWDDPEPFDRLCRQAISIERLAAAGAAGPIAFGLYRLQYSRSKTARAAG